MPEITADRNHNLRIPLSMRFLIVALLILLLNGVIMTQRSDAVMEEAFLSETSSQIGILLDTLGRNIELGRLPATD